MSCTRALSFRQKRTGEIGLISIVKCRRNFAKKALKQFLSDQLVSSLAAGNSSSPLSLSFWPRIKKFMKSSSSSSSLSFHGFILPHKEVIKTPNKMCEVAADYYEIFLKEPENIYHLHPYTDSPEVKWENYDEEIPSASLSEILDIVRSCKKRNHAILMASQVLCSTHYHCLISRFL